MVNICLAWWVKDPRSYNMWRNSMQCLPCGDTLKRYKNCLQQKPGLSKSMMAWMRKEADRAGLKPHQCVGGLVLDEMSIQEDLSLIHKGMDTYYAGLVSTTPLGKHLENERQGTIRLLINHLS